MERLRSRDFYVPVGGHVSLRTLPQCFGCGADTEFTWKLCPSCGQSTKKRKKCVIPPKGLLQGPPKTSASGQSVMASPAKRETDGDYEHDWAAPDYDLTDSKAKQQILEFCQPELSEKDQEKVFVHIVDISHGRATTVADPYDPRRKWKTYDPLDNVGFFNPKSRGEGEGEPDVMDVPPGGWSTMVPKLFLPASKHVKTLYCYLRMSKRETGDTLARAQREELERVVEAAIDEWKLERKVGPQIGTHNATPSRCGSHNGSQQPSVSGTPSQQAGPERSTQPTGQGRAAAVAAQMETVTEEEECST